MSTCSYVSMKSEFFYEHFNKAYTYFPHPLYSHTKKDAQVAHPFLLTFHFSPHPQLKKQILTDYPDFYGQNVSNDK